MLMCVRNTEARLVHTQYMFDTVFPREAALNEDTRLGN